MVNNEIELEKATIYSFGKVFTEYKQEYIKNIPSLKDVALLYKQLYAIA